MQDPRAGSPRSLNAISTGLSQLLTAEANSKLSVASSHLIVTSLGQVIEGGFVSITRMNWSHVAVLPQLSVAVHVRVTRISSGHVLSVKLSVQAISTGLLLESTADANPRLSTVTGSSHWIVASLGQVRKSLQTARKRSAFTPAKNQDKSPP